MIFGFGFSILSLLLLNVFPQTGDAIALGYGAPVLAFEFARTPQDLRDIFGPFNDPQYKARLHGMWAGNKYDDLYMLFYAGFLGCGLVALWRETGWRLLGFAALLPIIAALCDAYENRLLYDVLRAVAAGELLPQALGAQIPFVVAKFLFLAAGLTTVGLTLIRLGQRWRILGVAVVIGTIPTLLGVAFPHLFATLMVTSSSIGWVALLLIALWAYFLAFTKRPSIGGQWS